MCSSVSSLDAMDTYFYMFVYKPSQPKVYITLMMMEMMVICYDHANKTDSTGGAGAVTVSLSAHISQSSRDKLKLYQRIYGFRNASDAIEDILSKMPVPTKKDRNVDDPNQTKLPGV